MGDGRRTFGIPGPESICFFFCFRRESVITFTMSFRPTCSDIKSILLHRCFRCQGLRAGSPQLLPGTSPTEGFRAPGWVTLPAPQRTSSLAIPLPPSSKRSARSSCGSPRNRAQYRTSTADQPPLQVCQVSASCGSKTKRKSTEWVFVRVGSSISGQAARGMEEVAIVEDARKTTHGSSPSRVSNLVATWIQSRCVYFGPRASSYTHTHTKERKRNQNPDLN